MKRILSILLILVFVASSVFTTFAHGGRTDSSGGHKDNKNASGLGSYHYHHGYGPHLHPNGVCPYTAVSNNTTPNNNSSTSSTTQTVPTQNSSTSSSNTKSETPTLKKQKAEVIVEKTAVYKTASTKAEKLIDIKEGYTFTITGSTKSFLKLQYKLKNDDTQYSGYVLKSDTKEIK